MGDEDKESSEDEMPKDESTFSTKLYCCSQDKSAANYSKYESKILHSKRRRRTVQQRYACAGRISIIIPNNVNGACIRIPSVRILKLLDSQILVQFRHKCGHPARAIIPIPSKDG